MQGATPRTSAAPSSAVKEPPAPTTEKEDDRNIFEKLRDLVSYTGEKAASGAVEGVEGVVNTGGYVQQLLQKSAMQQAAGGAALAAEYTDNPYVTKAAERQREEAQKALTDPMKNVADFGDRYAQKVEEKYADKPLSKATRIVGDVAQGVGGLVPSVAANLILPGSGLAVMTTGSIGNATQEAKKAGADDAHALAYGVAVGAIEAATEKLLGGMGGLFGKGALDDVAKNAIRTRVSSPAVAAGMTTLVSALGEGTEEFLSEFATALANKGLIKTDTRTGKEILSDAGYSALIGGIIGSLANVGESIEAGRSVTPKQAALEAVENASKSIESSTDSEAVFSPSERLSSEPTTDASAKQNTIRDMPGNATEALQNETSRDTVKPTDPRVVRALEMLESGATNSQIYNETGLVATNTELLDDFGGPTVWRLRDGSGAGDEVRSGRASDGASETGVSEYDRGRIEAGRDANGKRPTWEELDESRRAAAIKSITDAMDVAYTAELASLRALYGDDAALAERIYNDYAAGNVVLEKWTSLLKGTEHVSDALDRIVLPDGMGAMSKDANINRGPQVETQSKSTVQNKNLTEEQRAQVTPAPHERISERESLHRAQTGLYTDSEGNIVGYEESIDDLLNLDRAMSGVESDRLHLLLAEAGRRNDVKNIKRITRKLQGDKSFVAQALQATQKWIGDSPVSNIARIITIVDKYAETHKARKGKTIEVPDSLVEAYTKAETDAARDEVVEQIQKYVADQTGATLLEKWNAIRYTNMLGNFKTQTRNILGNVANRAMYAVKDEVAALIELALPADQRTKSLSVGRDWMQAAKADYANAKGTINRYGKYKAENTESDFLSGIEDNRRILDTPLEYYRKGTEWAMTKGDEIFSKGAYARALSGYLKAKGVSPESLAAGSVDTGIMEAAREYAVKQAQEVTFRDSNKFSDWVSRIGRRADTPTAVKVIAEGVAPFRRTPANVMVRAAEYSPLGLLNTAVQAAKAKKSGGEITASDIIDSLSKNLTGSAVFALGMLLADAGLLRATGDDEAEDVDALMNRQDYSLVIPGGGSYTLDWLTPASLIMFTGAELMEMIGDEGFTWADIESAITSLADPLINMSMLSGVNDTLDNIKYSDNNLIQMAATSALSYLTQGLTNTLAGQIERIAEPERMSTYVDKEDAVPDWLERSLGKASAKTPGKDFNQTEYLDEFGNTESSGGLGERIFENLISPGYFNEGNEGRAAYDFAQEAFETLGYNPAPDAYAPKSVVGPDGTVKLTQSEQEQYQRVRGERAEELLEAASNNEAYESLSNEEKVKVLEDLKSQASEEAKLNVLSDRGVAVEQNATEKAIAALGAGDMVTYYAYWNDMDVPEHYTGNPDWQKFQTVLDMGFDDSVSLGLMDTINEGTGKKFRAAYDEGVPLDEIVAYYEAVNSKKPDGSKKKSADKKRAVRELEFERSRNRAILNRIF